jgi:hypothetical protein
MLALALALAGLAAVPTADDAALQDKARAFRSALVDRHVAPEGIVLYRVNLTTLESDLASGGYPDLADTPMFTGVWAATACTRAAVETTPAGRLEATLDAEKALGGLELLTRVTGQPGLLARGVRRGPVLPDEAHKRWLPGAAPLDGYRFRGDVSRDQYANGLLPAVAACRTLFPERTRRLATEFAALLLDSGFRLRDPDGRATRFGDLSPGADLGLNSISQLTSYTALALAASMDPEPRFARAQDDLRDRHRALARSRTTNVRVLGITNHSNDLMAWHLYAALVPLARRTRDPGLADLRHGMHRTWLRVRDDGNAYFTALFCRTEPESCDRAALAQARALLAGFRLEKRQVAAAPELADLPRRFLPARKLAPAARDPVPIELRSPTSFEWKSSPYRLERGPERLEIEYTGLDYLAAYWTLRAAETETR